MNQNQNNPKKILNNEEKLEKEVARVLENYPSGAAFLAAVSGGADSTALLSALAAVGKKRGFRLSCLHVDHGIRPASERRADVEFVKSLCEKFEIPCTIVVIPAGKIEAVAKERGCGIEAAARRFRQSAWTREMRRVEAARVLVAHTQDDLLETILMRLLKGSGPTGLAGMRRENNPVLRPLLSLTRADILAYLEKRAIPFRTDSTNADIRFFRNRVRHKLMPVLSTFFPDWRKNLLSLAEIQRETADFIKHETESHIQWEEDGAGGLSTLLENFERSDTIIQEEALYQAINRISDKKKKKEKKPRRSVLKLFCEKEKSAVQTGGARIAARRERVFVTSEKRDGEEQKVVETGFALLIKTSGIYTIGERTVEVFEGRFPFILRSGTRGKITAEYADDCENYANGGKGEKGEKEWQIIK